MEMEEYKPTAEELAAAQKRFAAYLSVPAKSDLDPAERAALDRLIAVALRGTGQSRIIADFLLAWWNSSECGAFAPTDLWGLDKGTSDDVCRIFHAIGSMAKYPYALGYEEQFNRLVRRWRPQLIGKDKAEEQQPGAQTRA